MRLRGQGHRRGTGFGDDDVEYRIEWSYPGLTRLTYAPAPHPDRELDARPVADTLYHALAASLLLAEGQQLRERTGDCRKLLAALLYIRRWLRPPAPPAPLLPPEALPWLDALADWTPVPAEALATA